MNLNLGTMVEKAFKWMDMIYKGAVIAGSAAIVWAQATFASKEDIAKVSQAIHQMEIQVQALNLGLVSQTAERGHLSKEVDGLRDFAKEMDSRLRSLERK